MTSLAVPVHVQGVDVTIKTTTVWKVEGPTEQKVSDLVHLVPDHSEEFTFMLPAKRLIELSWTLLRIIREGHVGTRIGPILQRLSGDPITLIFADFRFPTKARVKAPTESMTKLLAVGLTQIEESWTQELEKGIASVVPPFDPTKIRVEMRHARVDMTSFDESSSVSAFPEEEITVQYRDNGVELVGRYRMSPLMLTETRLPIEEILRLLTRDLQKKWNERFGLTQDEVLAAGVLNKGGLMDKGALGKSLIVPNGGDISVSMAPRQEKKKLPKWNEIDARVNVESTEITAAEMNRQMTAMQSKTEKTIEAIQKMSMSIKWTAAELRELIGILDDH